MKKTIAVWFSCGAASAVAAKKTIEKYGETHNILIINNPVKEEDEDNQRFLNDVSKWIGQPILRALNKNYPNFSCVDVWEKGYMSGQTQYGATCTFELKIKARQQFEETNKIDSHVFGFTLEEKSRHDNFTKFERTNVIPVLIDAKLTKQDCFDILMSNDIELPRIYKLGYPNANCIGCVKATSPTYWNHVRKMHPQTFNERAEQSRKIGAKLVRYKGKRIFLDELPEDAIGRKMKSYECGIFCDTK
ncbi:MAG: hypothetical protein IPP56_13710 [Bacteroidetes bacterium]|nr:hypothetical protein [Bacteroidota bacterium]